MEKRKTRGPLVLPLRLARQIEAVGIAGRGIKVNQRTDASFPGVEKCVGIGEKKNKRADDENGQGDGNHCHGVQETVVQDILNSPFEKKQLHYTMNLPSLS